MSQIPTLPTSVSPDGREIWYWAAKLSAHQQRQDKIARLKREIASPRVCGDCHKWMKSRECPAERNVNGRNRGPSMNGYPCGQFLVNAQATELREKRRRELADLLSPPVLQGGLSEGGR